MPPKTKEELRKEREAIRKRKQANLAKLKPLKKEVEGLDEKIAHQSKLIAEKTKKIRAQNKPLNAKALAVAETMIGVMEQGGNNTGPEVDKIIRANGGVIGEPWCGDFVAFCYRQAGSKKVDRSWASVNAIEGGNYGDFVRTNNPAAGDVVTYSFSHTGIFKRWIDRAKGLFETIEGNTGSIGAVSDSLTGGDGVYDKNRNTNLGVSFWKVTG